MIHFCELYTLLSLFLSLNVYFTVKIICCDIHGVSLVDRLWHKTLLRCRREHTGINRPRDQTRALPRNNNKCYFVQGVKSPKILAEDGVRHVFDSYRNPDERMLLSLLHFRPNRCWSTLWYITCFQLNSSFFEGNANARPQLKRTTI